MKALSYLPPWGTLQVHGRKLIETRGWAPTEKTMRPGDLFAVHHSQAWNVDDRERLEFAFGRREGGGPLAETAPNDWDRMAAALVSLGYGRDLKLPTGALLGVMRYLGAMTTEDLLANRDRYGLTADEEAFGNYGRRRKGWLTEPVLILPEPLPAKGMQGLWDVPHEPLAEILALLRAVGVEVPAETATAPAPLGLDRMLQGRLL